MIDEDRIKKSGRGIREEKEIFLPRQGVVSGESLLISFHIGNRGGVPKSFPERAKKPERKL